MRLIVYIFIALFGVISLSNCKRSIPEPTDYPTTIHQTTPYDLKIPLGFPEMVIPENNPLTVEGVTLGRKLYYDRILDKDSARACASCHHQDQAFQIDNGTQQVLPHANFGWMTNYMWNGGFNGTLEDVMIFEVEVFFETNMDRLNNSKIYRELFKKAFNVDSITSKDAAFALAQFARTMNSGNSKFDQFINGAVLLTQQELQGQQLFFTEKADCFHCHGTIFLTDFTPRNNGLDANPDAGLMEVTGNPKDLGKFKTPTLRNIELTAPYMHDGRFNTLEEVVDFYSGGVHNTSTVDPLMVYAHNGGVSLTQEEKEALIAFLKTFTDQEFLNNPELASPF
ncbi:cytochrome-c peroxidase [bacterium SCSIO 12643]|nr:cytochrome-c peroxidase [bacterium SCSIO 12643]